VRRANNDARNPWLCVLLAGLTITPGLSHALPTVTAGSATVHVGDIFTIPFTSPENSP